MSDANTIVIVSNRQELIKQVSQKLALLRNLDKIRSCSLEEAQDMLDDYYPNVIVLHCDNNNTQTINLIKKLKKQEKYKNLPILLLNDNCSRETIIEAFDNGISDVLFMPIIDYELLIRIIWCLQKNEMNLNLESRTNLLTNLGILQEETGTYGQKYYREFLKNEIIQTKKYNAKACILLISPDKKYPNNKSQKEFIEIIQKSIRLNDSIAIKDTNEYYVYLQKTKLNGAYSVFERINNNLGIDSGANAGVVEVQEQDFEDIIKMLDEALKKANENSNSLIVASDFYAPKKQNSVNISMNFEAKKANNLNLQNEEMPSVKAQNAFDKNSIFLFNQAFKRKIKFVLEPVFQKYENILRIKKQELALNSYVGTKSLFSISNGNICASLTVEYDGIDKVTILSSIVQNDQSKLHESETLDFTILDHRRLSVVLTKLIDKFISIIKNN